VDGWSWVIIDDNMTWALAVSVMEAAATTATQDGLAWTGEATFS